MATVRSWARAGGAAALLSTAVLLGTVPAGALVPGRGPSSSQTPYLTGVQPGVLFQSLLTTYDDVPKAGGGTYKFAGIPDGIGALDHDALTFTALVNHEIPGNPSALGVPRRHGGAGAFVTRLVINKVTGAVVSGEDLIRQVFLDGSATPTPNVVFSRFCSADLPAVSAFYNAGTGLGTQTRIFMNGEESGAEGRPFGHVVTGPEAGNSYELPALGNMSFENSVANPGSGDRTLVIETDDSAPGQVYLYVGDKKSAGTDVERAGLTGGDLEGIVVTGVAAEDRTNGLSTATPTFSARFTLASLGDVSAMTGAQIEAASRGAGITQFLRPEDAVWDPGDPSVFYFVTTDRYDEVKDGVGSQVGRSRLWKVQLDSRTDPTGGTITALLDGSEAHNMLDNMTDDGVGHLILLEGAGNRPHNSKIWQYTKATDTLTLVAHHDPARFGDLALPATLPFSPDEESSGVIPAFDLLGPGWFLIDDQAHYTSSVIPPLTNDETVEGGQLLAMFLPDAVTGPPPVIPEVPFLPLLPLPAVGALGTALLTRQIRAGGRRRD